LPIYLRPCSVPAELAPYQAINSPDRTLADLKDDPAEQDRIWVRALEKIRETLAELILVTAASEDRDAAEEILRRLEETDLRFDLELYDRTEDVELHQRVQVKLARCQAALLLIGKRGLGLWEVAAMQKALRAQLEKALDHAAPSRLVSALLPGVRSDLRMPAFLPKNTCIRFSRGLEDAATRGRIRVGLTGEWQPSATPTAPSADELRDTAISTPEPQPTDASPPAAPDADRRQIDSLVHGLAYENLTVFLGNDVVPAADPEALTEEMPPLRAYELARELVDELGGPESDPLLLSLDVAGAYFAVRNGERSLDFKIRDLVSRRITPTPTHRQIARLFHTLQELEHGGGFSRRAKRPVRMIVTTNIDLLMERALLLAEVPFVRLVQSELGEKIVVNEYRTVTAGEDQLMVGTGGDERTLRLGDDDGLCRAIADLGRLDFVYRDSGAAASADDACQNPLRSLPLDRFEPQVFLYKFHGSEDVERSCTISVDHHFRLLKAVLEKNVIPLKVTEYLSGGPVLLFGYGLLDPPFRVLFHTLPIGARANIDGDDRRFLLQLPPAADDPDNFRRLEQRLWPKIKDQAERSGIAVVEKPGDSFLEELIQSLGEQWGGGDAAPA
ncbi:MAG: SIR2 family protein, partial [Thermoanaerobaculia bacterium]